MTYNQRVNDYLALSNPPSATAPLEDIQFRFENVFANFKTGATDANIKDLYAEKFYFNDTFKTITDINALIQYMEETADNVESTNVAILDIAKGKDDYYLRWSMTMSFTAKGRKVESTSIGMTQLRFNEQGKVVLHQDYWDGAEGFYQHLPIIGYFVRKVRDSL